MEKPMWFQFPEGTTALSVQQQEFCIEAVDKDGRGYFRAPDHFAGIILDQPGFRSAIAPEGAPEDLPVADPLHDNTITQLSAQVDTLRFENSNFRAIIAELSAERDDLKLKLFESQARVNELEEPELGEFGVQGKSKSK